MLTEIIKKSIHEERDAKISIYINDTSTVSNYLLSRKIIKMMSSELKGYSLSEDVDNYLITYTDNLNKNQLIKCYDLIKEKGVIKMLTTINDTKDNYLLKLIYS